MTDGLRLSPYLSLDPRISIVRHELSPLDLPSANRPLRRDCLRVLMIDASDISGWPTLTDEDSRLVSEAIAREADATLIELEVLPDPSMSSLEKARPPRHSMPCTLSGTQNHGWLTSTLILQSDGGAAEPVDSDRFAPRLQEGDVRMALLVACDTANRSESSAWASLASELIVRGLPCQRSSQCSTPLRAATQRSSK